MVRWKLDDEIRDPLCDLVEVSFQLGSEVRWLNFVTPSYLARQLPQSGHRYRVDHSMVVVMEITAETISRCVYHLLEQGHLAEHSRPLESSPNEWFDDLPVE